MRICIPIPCFFGGMDFCDAIRKTGELGFDCAETYNWKDLDLDKVRATCEETGVELRSMCTTEFRMTDPAFRKEWLAGLKESCEAAKRVGASRLITQVGQDTGAPREEQHAAIVETLKQAKPILEDTGIIIMLEPLNTIVNHPGYYLWQSSEAFDIIHEVDHPLVKIVYDIYHQQVMEGTIIPSITNNLDCTPQVIPDASISSSARTITTSSSRRSTKPATRARAVSSSDRPSAALSRLRSSSAFMGRISR